MSLSRSLAQCMRYIKTYHDDALYSSCNREFLTRYWQGPGQYYLNALIDAITASDEPEAALAFCVNEINNTLTAAEKNFSATLYKTSCLGGNLKTKVVIFPYKKVMEALYTAFDESWAAPKVRSLNWMDLGTVLLQAPGEILRSPKSLLLITLSLVESSFAQSLTVTHQPEEPFLEIYGRPGGGKDFDEIKALIALDSKGEYCTSSPCLKAYIPAIKIVNKAIANDNGGAFSRINLKAVVAAEGPFVLQQLLEQIIIHQAKSCLVEYGKQLEVINHAWSLDEREFFWERVLLIYETHVLRENDPTGHFLKMIYHRTEKIFAAHFRTPATVYLVSMRSEINLVDITMRDAISFNRPELVGRLLNPSLLDEQWQRNSQKKNDEFAVILLGWTQFAVQVNSLDCVPILLKSVNIFSHPKDYNRPSQLSNQALEVACYLIEQVQDKKVLAAIYQNLSPLHQDISTSVEATYLAVLLLMAQVFENEPAEALLLESLSEHNLRFVLREVDNNSNNFKSYMKQLGLGVAAYDPLLNALTEAFAKYQIDYFSSAKQMFSSIFSFPAVSAEDTEPQPQLGFGI